jgi:hypothetical protein
MQTSRAEHWGTLISTSHYQALVEIRSALTQNNVSDAMQGLNEYIETLARQDLHACLSHIINIMLHVLKWKQQPEKRSRSWLLSIENGRDEVEDIRKLVPSITQAVLQREWAGCLKRAKKNAALQMGVDQRSLLLIELTWEEVFEQEYPYQDLPLFND